MKSEPEIVRMYARGKDYFSGVSDELVDTLKLLALLLVETDLELDRLQQPVVSGRIRLMWISRSLRGFENEKEPIPVKWGFNRLKRTWSAKEVPLRGLTARVKPSGSNADQIRVLLREFQVLLELYRATRHRLVRLDADWVRAKPYVGGKIDLVVGRRSG